MLWEVPRPESMTIPRGMTQLWKTSGDRRPRCWTRADDGNLAGLYSYCGHGKLSAEGMFTLSFHLLRRDSICVDLAEGFLPLAKESIPVAPNMRLQVNIVCKCHAHIPKLRFNGQRQ